MESDDDYESFSLPNTLPSPSHSPLKRLKRPKKATDTVKEKPNEQPKFVEAVSELIDIPEVDFAKLEALESSDIRLFDESGDDSPLSEDSKRSLEVDDDESGKDKEVRLCYDEVTSDKNEQKEDTKEAEVGGDVVVRVDRKETKRVLEFGDEINESELGERVEKSEESLDGDKINIELMCGTKWKKKRVRSSREERKAQKTYTSKGKEEKERKGESVDLEIRGDDEKEVDVDAMTEKNGKTKRVKSASEEPEVKSSKMSKRKEEKERKAYLEQLHAESQRILRETRGVSFKSVPLVQKPISSILDKIRQRKLEMSKKFSQSISNDLDIEDDVCVKHDAVDRCKSVETEVGDLSETVKEDKVSSEVNGDPESDDVGTDVPSDVSGEQKTPMALNEECTPVLRAPVDDTQELFGDEQSLNSKESEDEESCEQINSSQEEEMGPSLLTMKLKFDSVPDDISDEEDNDKENANPHGERLVEDSSSPKGDPVKGFVDDEAEEEDDSDNDQMLFGDDEENEEDDDIEELRAMIATGYKEKPIDKETRDELHKKWLEEKDAAGTDDLLRRLNVSSKLREASLLDEEDGVEDVEMIDDGEEEEERPRAARLDSKKAKEMIANMFTDKDEDFLSSDDEETKKILVKQRVLNKAEERGKLMSPSEDEDSREVFCLIKKVNTGPEVRKKAKTTSFFDTLLTGGNSNSSSKSSFLSRASNHSIPTSSRQGGSSGVRSFIFGRDDSNSRSSISISEDTSDTITSREVQTKKVTTKYSSSQSQFRSSTQTTKHVSESSNNTSLFEILKRSSMQSNVHKEEHKVELSQSVFAAFKIPKKPVKIPGRA